jgi:hypothetical protein
MSEAALAFVCVVAIVGIVAVVGILSKQWIHLKAKRGEVDIKSRPTE